MRPEEIKQLIEAGLKGADVFVEGDGAHFSAIVISPCFSGLSRIKKQQLVHDTGKKQLLDGSLHALSIQTFTPAEWEQLDQHLTHGEN
jgi:acid stress-induced BolA-like protein IbaG/YrbA